MGSAFPMREAGVWVILDVDLDLLSETRIVADAPVVIVLPAHTAWYNERVGSLARVGCSMR